MIHDPNADAFHLILYWALNKSLCFPFTISRPYKKAMTDGDPNYGAEPNQNFGTVIRTKKSIDLSRLTAHSRIVFQSVDNINKHVLPFARSA